MPETTIPITKTDIADILQAINVLEMSGSDREVTSISAEREATNPNNFLGFVFNAKDLPLPVPHLEIISGTPEQQDAKIQEIGEVNTLVDYAEMLVKGPGQNAATFQNVLFFREGRTITLKGKMSHFGGKDDTTLADDEPLAIVQNDNFEHYKTLFVNEEKGGDFPHAKNLNPATSYIACRWDYRVTPRLRLRECMITVKNTANAKTEQAVAVDWGPNVVLDRVADLSPGLADKLGLKTGHVCEVVITLPPGLLHDMVQDPEGMGAPGDGVRYLSEQEVISLFGNPKPTTPAANGAVVPRPGFIDLLGTAHIPSLAGIKGAPLNQKVDCHKKVKAALEAAFAEIAVEGLTNRILSWDGMFVPRHINRDTGKPLSRHTWGIAFDINAKFNPYKTKPAKPGTEGSVHELVPIFERHGFYWGGRFKSTPDGMHFEWGRITA